MWGILCEWPRPAGQVELGGGGEMLCQGVGGGPGAVEMSRCLIWFFTWLSRACALLCGLHCTSVKVSRTVAGLNWCGQIFEVRAFHIFLGL